ncbi:methionyl-tRNA formyltransferase [[Clostridium] methylpentosum DSM 5476]|uniref:Methionyl-tRNA formyltransferase n=1 Tax=[Clostridium] methylpentosum DSM 5476 TaxID=537013 RepID=C0EFK5_9FIRM|nr:methionyl-tRNA formyltransferase [[Clostridium] methylpentosum DSM 5476]
MKNNMKLVFMGTPDFAAASLQRLIDSGKHEILAVYTQPDKPKGRGYKLAPPPVKVLALEHGIPVFQPVSLKEESVLEQLEAFSPDLIAVVAYGRILPSAVLELPKFGCVNLHGSLLPKYRGAAPIQWSVLNGDPVAGVTTMYMAEGLDTGDMILKAETEIGADETSSELYDRLAQIGAGLLLETFDQIEAGTAPRTPQDDALSCYAPMLSREMSLVDFSQPASKVHNLIRGLSDWPAAHATIGGKKLKIFQSTLAEGYRGEPGELLDSKRFVVGCGDGAVELLSVQFEGSKRMSGRDFLNGKRIAQGEFLNRS